MKLTKEAYWLSRNPRAEIDLHNRIQAQHAHALANSNLLLPDPRSSARVAAFHILANRLDRKYQRVLFKALRPVVIDPLLAHLPVDEDISVAQMLLQQQQQLQLVTQTLEQTNAALAALRSQAVPPAQVQQDAAPPQPAPAAPAAPQLVTLKPPKPEKYSGQDPKRRLQAWTFEMRHYLQASGRDLDTVQAVQDTIPYLSGQLANWYEVQARSAPSGQPFPTFHALAEALHTYLLPQDQSVEARRLLYRIQQTGAVSGYNSRFNELLLQVPDMAAADQLQLYVEGLKLEVKKLLLSANRPTTLPEAMSRAADIDGTLYPSRRQSGYYPTHSAASTAPHNGPAPMELGATQAETRRCWACNDEGHLARDCPRNTQQGGRGYTYNTNRGRGRGRGPRGRGRSNTHRGAPN
jgi:hypothetical protein